MSHTTDLEQMNPDQLRWELGELDSMIPAVDALDAKLAGVEEGLAAAISAGDEALEGAVTEVEDIVRAADEGDQLAAARAALS